MSELIAYYEERPIEVGGAVEILQAPKASASGLQSVEGVIRPGLVYVSVPQPTGPFLVPFGSYDEWSLRDRYSEAMRIMNTLGASEISIEAFREVSMKKGIRARVLPFGRGRIEKQRLENSSFDFHHVGAGSPPRDPRPLSWPHEPGFAAAVASVLENKSTSVSIRITSHGSHAIDGSLGIQLKAVGFHLGGGVQHTGATSLEIRATFPQKKGIW